MTGTLETAMLISGIAEVDSKSPSVLSEGLSFRSVAAGPTRTAAVSEPSLPQALSGPQGLATPHLLE